MPMDVAVSTWEREREKLEWMERGQCEMLQSRKMHLAVTWTVLC